MTVSCKLCLATIDPAVLIRNPLIWGILCGSVALALLLPYRSRQARWPGVVMGILGAGLVITGLPLELHWSEAGLFYVLTVITLVSAVATISMENAVYAAIWFALSLLGTAGLFFFQGAQFVAVATIVVYAGAIVVTLLFVIMLAQPDGQATYDRISWARSSKTVSVITAALLVALLTITLEQVAPSLSATTLPTDLLQTEHVALLGKHLFTEHLIEIEIAGTLLLVALVGAVAVLIHAKEESSPDPISNDE